MISAVVLVDNYVNILQLLWLFLSLSYYYVVVDVVIAVVVDVGDRGDGGC